MTFCLSKSGNSCPNREKNIKSIGNINSIEKLDILKILDILKCPPSPHITSPSIQLHHCQPPLSEICRQILSPSPPFINVALISYNIDLCDLCLELSLFFHFFILSLRISTGPKILFQIVLKWWILALTREAHRERRSPGKKEYEEENYIITPEKDLKTTRNSQYLMSSSGFQTPWNDFFRRNHLLQRTHQHWKSNPMGSILGVCDNQKLNRNILLHL